MYWYRSGECAEHRQQARCRRAIGQLRASRSPAAARRGTRGTGGAASAVAVAAARRIDGDPVALDQPADLGAMQAERSRRRGDVAGVAAQCVLEPVAPRVVELWRALARLP